MILPGFLLPEITPFLSPAPENRKNSFGTTSAVFLAYLLLSDFLKNFFEAPQADIMCHLFLLYYF